MAGDAGGRGPKQPNHDSPAASKAEASWEATIQPADISVVICAYTMDRWDDMGRAIESVAVQRSPVRETILVIDHNQELMQRAQRELRGITVVANGEERGLSGGRNTGVAIARGEVVAFLDDDATAAPDWSERLADGYVDKWVLGVGGVSEAAWVGGRPPWFPAEFDWVVGCSYIGMPVERASVRNMIGSNMSLRRGVFEHLGGFDSRIGRVGAIPVGCEETELCIRAVVAWPLGRIVYEPMAHVTHTVPVSRGSWRYFRSRCLAEGRSKAVVARLVGRRAGLATERNYVRRVLPTAIGRDLRTALTQRRLAPAVRALAVIMGLGLTTFGFLRGMTSERAVELNPEQAT
jgi:glucosyl-dolichyl phosphate glucuronosyltransferase